MNSHVIDSVASTGGGRGEPHHSVFDMTVAIIITESPLSGIVPEVNADTDAATNSHKNSNCQVSHKVFCSVLFGHNLNCDSHRMLCKWLHPH